MLSQLFSRCTFINNNQFNPDGIFAINVLLFSIVITYLIAQQYNILNRLLGAFTNYVYKKRWVGAYSKNAIAKC